jgi:hypothetical protein
MKSIAIVMAVFLGAFGAKLLFVTATTGGSDVRPVEGVRVDVSQLHRKANLLPVQKLHDMTFVFADRD